MKIAFMASDAIALKPIEFLHRAHELVCVVSNPDKPKGRGKKLSPNDVAQWALDNGVKLLRPEKKPTDADVARLRELGAELIVVMAYGCILKDNVLKYGKYPCLNLHASLLPELRGASPIETAIALGKKRTGVSLMAISPAMDEGDVADTEEVEISDSDTAKTLREKISAASAELLRRDLPLLERGELRWVEQESSRATYARKLSKADMFLDFAKPADVLLNRIRAFGAGIFTCGNDAVKIFDVSAESPEREFSDFGRVLSADSEGLKIACSRGVLVARTLQKPCSKILSARDFFAGYVIEKNSILQSAENSPLLK